MYCSTGNINFALSQELGHQLKAKNLKLVLAESCTGGGLAEEITAVDGCSEWFDRAYVTYSNAAKTDCLGVSPILLAQHGAVSKQTAEEMAKGALQRSLADISLSITGIAGPTGGTPDKPVGLVCFGLSVKKTGLTQSCTQHFYSGRKNIRRMAIQFALEWLLESVAHEGNTL